MPVGLFDIIGPVMVGPSSSHTAGAVRLGNIARRICGQPFQQVDFYLHGSFAQTYQGHGTDKALLGGVLGMTASDERIKDALAIAAQIGIKFAFHAVDLGSAHPNTVKIAIRVGPDVAPCTLTGASIGGGKVLITEINGMSVEFTGQYPTIISQHHDEPGVVAHVSAILAENGINIAFLKVFRQVRAGEASMVIETDQNADREIIRKLEALEGIKRIMFVVIDE